MSKPVSILLMDEDAATLEQLHTMLQREGYQVMAAVDGHAALRLARKFKPDLIVSDLLLAGLDGYEVWKMLRTDPEIPHIPVLVISALNVPGRSEPWRPAPHAEWQLLSYEAFLPKPIDLRRFLRVVQRLLVPDQAWVIPSGSSVIVAIEDEVIRQQLAAMLSQDDFGVETPATIGEAVNLVRSVPPAALMLDFRPPDGEAIRNIAQYTRKYVPGTAVIAVVDPGQEIDTGIINACDAFIGTPLHPALVTTTIHQTLNLTNLKRRTESLSSSLITTNRNLYLTQQALQAQNDELAYTNNKLRELDSLKEMLTGMVVHDLKAPLGAVLGALNFLLTSPQVEMPPRIERLVTGAVAAGNQLLRLTETLLEGQRLEEGRMKPDAEPFDLPTLVEATLEQISPLLALHRLEVASAIDDDLPMVYADPHISQRVLENLLDNAIKFSPPQTTMALVGTCQGNFVRISVTDQGPGIPKEHQAEIFNRFAQLKSPASVSRAGFGLGLAFCRIATDAMGGSIWVESDGESGTTFSFTLPIYIEK